MKSSFRVIVSVLLMAVIVASGGRAFIISGYTTTDLYNKQKGQIDAILYSFRLE